MSGVRLRIDRIREALTLSAPRSGCYLCADVPISVQQRILVQDPMRSFLGLLHLAVLGLWNRLNCRNGTVRRRADVHCHRGVARLLCLPGRDRQYALKRHQRTD